MTLSAEATDRVLGAWREYDAARVVHARDREAIGGSGAARALVLDLLVPPPSADPKDLYSACARLGRLLADADASPSFAVTILDGAVRALGEVGIQIEDARLLPCRAALAEGYAAAVRDAQIALGLGAWDYPRCAVRLDETTVAIAAGCPTDDREALADWAARVAVGASKDGFRVAIVTGATQARDEVVSALALVGVETKSSLDSRGWFRNPFSKSRR